MTDETPNLTAPDAAPDAGPPRVPPPVQDRPASSADVRAHRPEYKGEELDPERGPGLGCFWFQVIVLGFFIVLIPIGVNLNWPFELLAILLFFVLGLLLFTGQTVIFLLRLVAADRRAKGRRRPLASPTKTVGEIEDAHRVAHAAADVPAGADVAHAAADVPAGADVAHAVADVPADVDGGDVDALAADVPADVDGVVASQAMIRDPEVSIPPAVAAHVTESAGDPGSDDVAVGTHDVATGADITAGAPARTTEADAAVPADAAGGREEPMAPRMHESSPDGRRQGPAGDVPAAHAAADPAPPEEPDPGVRQ